MPPHSRLCQPAAPSKSTPQLCRTCLLEDGGGLLLCVVVLCNLVEVIKKLAPAQVLHDEHHLLAVIHHIFTADNARVAQRTQKLGLPTYDVCNFTLPSQGTASDHAGQSPRQLPCLIGPSTHPSTLHARPAKTVPCQAADNARSAGVCSRWAACLQAQQLAWPVAKECNTTDTAKTLLLWGPSMRNIAQCSLASQACACLPGAGCQPPGLQAQGQHHQTHSIRHCTACKVLSLAARACSPPHDCLVLLVQVRILHEYHFEGHVLAGDLLVLAQHHLQDGTGQQSWLQKRRNMHKVVLICNKLAKESSVPVAAEKAQQAAQGLTRKAAEHSGMTVAQAQQAAKESVAEALSCAILVDT